MKGTLMAVLMAGLLVPLAGCHWHYYERDYYYSERPTGYYRHYHYRDYGRYPYGYYGYRDRYDD